ncbi:hypothetical protein PGTUg99_018200 [Puccinia graminis f. sp. tritici]|uniref:Uncharacterized protein n=1 Tax=Puccinia graminis f. sp. tritici TaxID=56615 RepID=A0A5B0NWN6_PUCGR|nr:hypothetical protein PGTUg99_018200 [Puccinia graminis f. sp. tritici]
MNEEYAGRRASSGPSKAGSGSSLGEPESGFMEPPGVGLGEITEVRRRGGGGGGYLVRQGLVDEPGLSIAFAGEAALVVQGPGGVGGECLCADGVVLLEDCRRAGLLSESLLAQPRLPQIRPQIH